MTSTKKIPTTTFYSAKPVPAPAPPTKEKIIKAKKVVFKKKKPFTKNSKQFNGNPIDIGKKFGNGVGIEKSPIITPSEKPDWRKFKEEKKNLKFQRQSKTNKDLFLLKLESKKLYEKLKCRATEQRPALAEELYKLLNHDNNIQRFVLGHDTSRIIQCLLKHSSPKTRIEISNQLIPIAPVLARSKYAHFCVLRMIKYGSKNTKKRLIDSFMGNIIKLSSNVISSKIIDLIYFQNIANKLQKIHMKQEFYGDFYITAKDANVKKLSDTFSQSPNLRSGILSSLKEKLIHLANKNMTDNSLVHAVLYEYVQEILEASGNKVENELEEDEIVKTYSLLSPTLVTSSDGVKSAIWCFWFSSTKDRRAIVKSLKEHLMKIATHEHGYLFIIAIIHTLDDTKSIKKNIFDILLPNLSILLLNPWGRKIIDWFISAESKQSFHPELIDFFNSGLKYSKKDKEVRQSEIYQQIEEPLSNSLIGNPELWINNGHVGLILAAFFKVISNEAAEPAFKTISNQICSENWKIDNKTEKKNEKKNESENKTEKKNEKKNESEPIDGISDSRAHYVLMNILKNDQERSTKTLKPFGDILIDVLDIKIINGWIIHNRGCFVLLKLLETANDEKKPILKKKLMEAQELLKKQNSVGAKLLFEKLNK